MNTLLGFGILILVIINFIIYHKIFNVVYFDLAKGCSTEIFWIVIFTAFEIAIIKGIGQKILGMLGALLGFVGKMIIIVLVVSFAIFIVWKIAQAVRSKIDADGENKESMSSVQNDRRILKVSDVEMNTCASCGKVIKKGSKFCQFCGSKIDSNN